jgi:DNA repair ATPase RecN
VEEQKDLSQLVESTKQGQTLMQELEEQAQNLQDTDDNHREYVRPEISRIKKMVKDAKQRCDQLRNNNKSMMKLTKEGKNAVSSYGGRCVHWSSRWRRQNIVVSYYGVICIHSRTHFNGKKKNDN